MVNSNYLYNVNHWKYYVGGKGEAPRVWRYPAARVAGLVDFVKKVKVLDTEAQRVSREV